MYIAGMCVPTSTYPHDIVPVRIVPVPYRTVPIHELEYDVRYCSTVRYGR